MRFAFFGVYQTERFGEYVGSLAWLLAGGLTAVALVLAVLGVCGLFPPNFLIAVFALVGGTALYEGAFEVARTLHNVRMAALSMILRALLTVAFGSASLWFGGGARDLAIAVALAQIFAAIPSLTSFSRFRWSHATRAHRAAHPRLWLAAPSLLRRHRRRPEHRPAFACSLSRRRHARSLWRGCRCDAAELHGRRRGDHAVLGDDRQKSCERGRSPRHQRGAAADLQRLPRHRRLRRSFLHRVRRSHIAGRAQAGIHRTHPRPRSNLRHRLRVHHHAQFLFRAGDLFHPRELSRSGDLHSLRCRLHDAFVPACAGLRARMGERSR